MRSLDDGIGGGGGYWWVLRDVERMSGSESEESGERRGRREEDEMKADKGACLPLGPLHCTPSLDMRHNTSAHHYRFVDTFFCIHCAVSSKLLPSLARTHPIVRLLLRFPLTVTLAWS
jgi:hypothetical protein